MVRTAALGVAIAALLAHEHAVAVLPTVNLNYTRYQGTPLANGVTQWLGMRYAAPPLGDLRFEPPSDPHPVNTTQLANQHGNICIGTGDEPDAPGTSEDCLFIDVYAPTNATDKSNLPVFFFIQGGGFNMNANANYNGSGLIGASGGDGIVVVNFNYRVGPYGFLADGELVTPNVGLLDQRRALHWVRDHIACFGGDRDHVVLGGDSAGAASISLHLAAYGGRPAETLFHAAAIQSVSFAPVLTPAASRYQFGNLTQRAGCGTGSGSESDGDDDDEDDYDAAEALACLRAKTVAELQAANVGVPYPDPAGAARGAPLFMWNPVLDGDLVRELTYDAFGAGRFARVPVLVGDVTDGGSIFAPRNTSTAADSRQFLRDQFPDLTAAQLDRLDALYPNDNATGAACPPDDGCYFGQLSRAYGELRYMCPTLFVARACARSGGGDGDGGAPAFAFRWNVEDPGQVAKGLGVPHAVDVHAVFGPDYTNGAAPASYRAGGANAAIVPAVQAYWTSFVRTFDPNTDRLPGSAEWEPYDPDGWDRLLFNTTGVTEMESVDGGLRERCEYLWSIGPDLRQ